MTMRIIKKPFRVLPKLGEHGSNTTHQILMICCDDGNTYTLQQLADKVEMSRQKLIYQIKTMGWQHPEVLNSAYKEASTGKGQRRVLRGNASWQKLSDKPRFVKIANVPTGSLERRGAQPSGSKHE